VIEMFVIAPLFFLLLWGFTEPPDEAGPED